MGARSAAAERRRRRLARCAAARHMTTAMSAVTNAAASVPRWSYGERGRPVLIAEYGVPSSRGLAHLQPEGLHHGGHDEREMADQDVRLTREIHEAGLAGGILFAWQDEWFKHNWV